MKKILSLTLALALMLSLAIPAFAADTDSRNVTAKYEKTETEDEIRNFDLRWGELSFTYSEHTDKTWNPNTHTYTEETTGGWDKTEAEITVTNHSNIELTVSMALTPVEGTGVTATLTGGNGTLPAATVGDVEGAPAITGILKIDGKPNSTVTEAGIKVASITVTIE